MTDPVRILLVDDQQLIRLGFGLVLGAEDDLDVVGEASNGAEAIDLAASLRPDVILMDVRMPGLDGIEATRRIVAANPDSRIIILTTFDLDEYAFGALRAGASGFLLKDALPNELTSAIRAVHAGDAAVSTRITKRMLELFATALPGTPTAAEDGSAAELAELTPREHDILVAMAEGLSNAEIAAHFVLSESTVKTHVGRVLMKLQLRDRVQAVIFAYKHGLVRP
ncbi:MULTISPECIES: response regulator [Plantibacter]|uniref:response regulator n=1 Tax=Plantibacter TaxID=190323 RepID=UPI00178587E3|nr:MULTISPECIES: response regulator transcription factor [Plantibacter]MBD8102657.1 response regulator transcription factor [Plantibacter sp. CFBP 8775]MDD9152760.1 response regulator transcription factor [Plantibacter flavus]